VLSAQSRINTDADTLTINGTITGASQNLIVGGAGTTVLNGAIGTGSGTLTKDGTGTVIVAGNNTYAGATTVQNGVMNIRHSNALGSTAAGTTVWSGAELQLQNNISVGNESLSLSGTGFGANTGALRNVSGNNTWAGPITVASSSARINADAGLLTLSNTVALGSNALTVGGSGNTTISGQLTGANASVLNKDGSGTLTLANATNTFSGDVNVTAGTLAFGANNALNSSAIDLNVGGAGTVNLVSYAQSIGTLAGAGLIDFGTGGTLTLASSSTWSGAFTGSGTLIIGSGVTLTLASNIDASSLNIVLAGGTINMAGGTHVFGNLTVTGDSVLDFSGTSTFEIQNLYFDSLAHTLNVVNWTDAVDYFLSRDRPGFRHDPPLNQVVFTGWTGDHTTYQDWDNQITPVPEPSTYGAMLMGAGLAFFGYRRWRRQRQSNAKA
jgi:autotransporter-associated beta strand protein